MLEFMSENQTAFECPQMSEMATDASSYIAAIEGATGRVSLDALTGGKYLPSLLDEDLKAADSYWERHEEVFFADGLPPDLAKLDYDAALKLSRDVIRKVKMQGRLLQTAHLGITAIQFAAAGAEMVRDPSLVIVDDRPSDHTVMAQAITEKSGELAEDVFDATFSNRLKGDYSKLPSTYSGYLGCLMNTQAAFWRTNRFAPSNWGVVSQFPPEVDDRVEDMLLQYPAKALLFDNHSRQARPERKFSYPAEVRAICEFNDHWKGGGKVGAVNLKDNIDPAMAQINKALESAAERDIAPSQRLPLVARDASAIVDVTKRDSFGHLMREEGLVYFDGPAENPKLVAAFPELPKDIVLRATERLVRKSALAGACTARNFVAVPSGGETHSNTQEFYAGFKELFGLTHPALLERDGRMYLHVGLLGIHYPLLASAYNDFS